MAHNEPSAQARPAAVPAFRSGTFSGSIPAPLAAASSAPGPHVIQSIQISGLSDDAKAELLATLPVKVGDDFVALAPKIFAAVHQFDKHLTATLLPTPSGDAQLMITLPTAAPGVESTAGTVNKIRVGGNVQATNLINQVRPVYPAAAKEGRIQGVVQLEAIIGPDGHVQDLKVTSGHPLLAQAALEAVKDWVYRPTLLNGNPVTVVTSIDVNFTLSQ
jgi:TonB family protein